jgi:hypothetical protein
LPKVLDGITAAGGEFTIKNVAIGHDRSDPSFARIEVRAKSEAALEEIIAQIADHGAVAVHGGDARLVEADMDGAFPEGFYSTTNQKTEVRLGGHWIGVADQEMDCGIVVDDRSISCRCLPMTDVKRGMKVVVGHVGTRVFPLERQEQGMRSPSNAPSHREASSDSRSRGSCSRIGATGRSRCWSAGRRLSIPAAGRCVELLRDGYIHKLFAGTLATHDIEQSLFGTSLGVNLSEGTTVDAHEHHLRVNQPIRRGVDRGRGELGSCGAASCTSASSTTSASTCREYSRRWAAPRVVTDGCASGSWAMVKDVCFA